MRPPDDFDRAPPLPWVERPRGAAFWLGTWTGRILIVNTAMFALISVMSGSLFLPDMPTLLALGAKDPVGIAQGEWWRFVTPMFLHIGIVHFAVNSYMLSVIGYQLEAMLGPRWFVATYLAAGIGGNIGSAVFSPNLSAGASGALFGLLGAGFYLERTVGRRMAELTGRRGGRRVYALTVLLNLVIGLVIPFIDNAAHLGGFVVGLFMTIAMLRLRPNRLARTREALGRAILAALAACALYGASLATSKTYALGLILNAAERADQLDAKLHYAAQAYRIDPTDPRLAVFVTSLAADLEAQGYAREAEELRGYFR